ncbi:MAG: homoserine O-acetyltransferase [Phenylobacterium sp.]|uniref:homoserine O-acetyltransferase MetX n=1 Tax=Phenylobacterium sp. SCN 70-31 TaxID=1660129 RepID=UPI00086F69B6|nr:homoserine O-acetyltransferase [Phenylobacterium sp. SCN 70-31]MCW5758708.1 homoserine O-acetyltransferase [Phenylobacterium sp.]ODT89128.1 MAG: homoserine O-acetyltransferase [Phenylobacterium sp. SCN 70-31]
MTAPARIEAEIQSGGGTWRFPATRPLRLDSGATLAPLEIAYKTYGALNADKTNAVLVCHALTGDQHLASTHPVTGKPGWWDRFVGPGKPLDPTRHFIVCTNVIGGCMGTTGPASIDPATGEPYGLKFPVITIADMVRAQAMLIEDMGIETLFAAVGGSMGGMQVLQWAADYPEKLFSAVVIAAAARHSAQNIAFHEVGRQAIMADPNWCAGAYLQAGVRPEKGLAVARMAAHITYLSEAALQRKFGRELQRDGLSWGFDADFQVESYLRHQGASFVDRFDANSYLYITRALDYFDLAAQHGGVLAEAFVRARHVRFCVLSFSSDWLYPTPESRDVVRALNGAGCRASFAEIETDKGHDAFFLDEPLLDQTLKGFLAAQAQARGLDRGDLD